MLADTFTVVRTDLFAAAKLIEDHDTLIRAALDADDSTAKTLQLVASELLSLLRVIVDDASEHGTLRP